MAVVLQALQDLGGPDLGGLFTQMEWAEDEIRQAQQRHGDVRDDDTFPNEGPIWESFTLLRGTSELMRTEFVYRAHCRELLDRIAVGGDPREATNAELSIICSETSLRAPMHDGGITLYLRVFARAFPERQVADLEELALHERLHGHEADQLERELRRKARQSWRVPEKKEKASNAKAA